MKRLFEVAAIAAALLILAAGAVFVVPLALTIALARGVIRARVNHELRKVARL